MSSRPCLFSDLYPNYDASSQLRSIKELIDVVFTWRNSLHGDISEAEHDLRISPGGMEEMAAVASTHDLYHKSVYRDAAAVQASVGALAPFLENFFIHAFNYLSCLHRDAESLNSHPRWQRSLSLFWDVKNPNGIVSALFELREALELHEWLHESDLAHIELLFIFRNRSLHNAYEWPQEKLDAFSKCVEEKKWTNYVSWATSGNKPWMAYLKDVFLFETLKISQSIVSGFEKVANDRGGVFLADPGSLL